MRWRWWPFRMSHDRILDADLRRLNELLEELLAFLQEHVVDREPRHFRIEQLPLGAQGATMPTNNSIVAGTSGVFVATPVPPGSAPDPAQLVPAWVASDPAVAIKASADGLTASVAVPATDTGTGFTLGVSYTRKDGTVATGSVSVSIVQPTPPPAPEPTSFTISQTS